MEDFKQESASRSDQSLDAREAHCGKCEVRRCGSVGSGAS